MQVGTTAPEQKVRDISSRRRLIAEAEAKSLSMTASTPDKRPHSPNTSFAIVAKSRVPRATSEEMTNGPSELFVLE